jgi:hypothetical protein
MAPIEAALEVTWAARHDRPAAQSRVHADVLDRRSLRRTARRGLASRPRVPQ